MRLLLLLLLLPTLAWGRGPCAGETFPVTLRGGAPFIELMAAGARGPFLVDYGATESSMARTAFPGRQGPVRITDFGLTGLRDVEMLLFDYSGQRGIVGTNHLSLLTATLDIAARTLTLSPARCPEAVLRAAGLVPVDQDGFFAQDRRRVPSRPNVPILRLEIGPVAFWAQIDTGYEDSLYRHSIDVNASLMAALRRAGVAMERVGSVTVGTCAGSEEREVWRVGAARLAGGRELGAVHIIPKQANACGGIATMAEPAGQLGASFLATLGLVVFDPKNARVWIPAAR